MQQIDSIEIEEHINLIKKLKQVLHTSNRNYFKYNMLCPFDKSIVIILAKQIKSLLLDYYTNTSNKLIYE